MLKNFKLNSSRDVLIPNISLYQMNMLRPVKDLIKEMKIKDEKMKSLPSWAAIAANPIKNKSILVRIIQALFLGLGNYPELNVDDQAGIYYRDRPRTAMMFFPSNIRTEMLRMIGQIIREVLGGYRVIVLSGLEKHNGVKMTNHNIEAFVRGIIDEDPSKPIIIIAAAMGQRSFTVPEIDELYLAYDKGEQGATTQKMSRALSPGDENKVGKIFSLSFDPNRDDKFDSMIIESAISHKNRNPKKSLQESLSDVIRVIDFYIAGPNGAAKIEPSAYLRAAFERNSISRVLGKVVNFQLLSPEAIIALAQGNGNYFRNKKQEAAPIGKVRDPKKKEKTPVSEKRDLKAEKVIAKAREAITTIFENVDILIYGTGKSNISEAMTEIRNNKELRDAVNEEFQQPFEIIDYLFQNNVIQQDYVDLMISKGVM